MGKYVQQKQYVYANHTVDIMLMKSRAGVIFYFKYVTNYLVD